MNKKDFHDAALEGYRAGLQHKVEQIQNELISMSYFESLGLTSKEILFRVCPSFIGDVK